jgi:hypothetical protein
MDACFGAADLGQVAGLPAWSGGEIENVVLAPGTSSGATSIAL